jgi:hypothetical protein
MAKAARWRDEKRKAFGRTKFQTVETARAQNRKAGFAGLVPRNWWSFRAKPRPLSGPGRRDTVSEPPGGKGQVLAIDPGPRRNRHRRERRAIKKPVRVPARVFEQASRRQA